MKLFGIEIRKAPKEVRELNYVKCGSNTLNFGTLNSTCTAMNISAVYRAVEIISDSIGILPVQVKSRNQKHIDVLENHPLNLLFMDKYGTMTSYNFLKLLVQSVLLRGNGFAYIHRAENGRPTALQFIQSEDVNIFYDTKRPDKLYYTITGMRGKIEPVNLIHLVKNTFDGVNGISVLSFAKRTIGLANNTEDAAKNFFEHGCNLSGVLTVHSQLQDEQKEQIRTSWNTAYTNGGSGLAILQGNMEYKPIQISAADSQLLESRSYNVQDIARFFGISPILLGDLTHSSFNTLEAVQQQFLLHTLQPYIVMIEQEFTRKLVMPSEKNIFLNLDETALLKTNKIDVANYYSTLLKNGVLCVDEVRRELGYSEIGATQHIIPYTDVNMNKVDGNKTEEEKKDEE